MDSNKIVLIDDPTSKHNKINQCGLNLKEVGSNLPTCACNISYENKLLVINRTIHLLVLDVISLLCEAHHLKSMKIWKPLNLATRCGNKFISPWPHSFEFLELCSNHFDIIILSSTTFANLRPMVDFLLKGESGLKPLFLWNVDKCLDIHLANPLNP